MDANNDRTKLSLIQFSLHYPNLLKCILGNIGILHYNNFILFKPTFFESFSFYHLWIICIHHNC